MPTPEPTEEPTPEPTEEPTPEPTEEPTPEPTEEPTPEPTEEPTPKPIKKPEKPNDDPAEPKAFTRGYVYLPRNCQVFAKKRMKSSDVLGVIAEEDAIVYLFEQGEEGDPDAPVHLVFCVYEEDELRQIDGYTPAQYVRPLSEADADRYQSTLIQSGDYLPFSKDERIALGAVQFILHLVTEQEETKPEQPAESAKDLGTSAEEEGRPDTGRDEQTQQEGSPKPEWSQDGTEDNPPETASPAQTSEAFSNPPEAMPDSQTDEGALADGLQAEGSRTAVRMDQFEEPESTHSSSDSAARTGELGSETGEAEAILEASIQMAKATLLMEEPVESAHVQEEQSPAQDGEMRQAIGNAFDGMDEFDIPSDSPEGIDEPALLKGEIMASEGIEQIETEDEAPKLELPVGDPAFEEQAEAAFTPVEFTPNVVLSHGEEAMTLELRANEYNPEGAELGEERRLSLTAGETDSFDSIRFTKAGRYGFGIVETEQKAEPWELEVVVEQNPENGALYIDTTSTVYSNPNDPTQSNNESARFAPLLTVSNLTIEQEGPKVRSLRQASPKAPETLRTTAEIFARVEVSPQIDLIENGVLYAPSLQWQFKVALVPIGNAPMPTDVGPDGSKEIALTHALRSENPSAQSFGEIQYELPEGENSITYMYQVCDRTHGSEGAAPYLKFDTTDHKVTVRIERVDGQAKASVIYEEQPDETCITLHNIYCCANLNIHKTLDGAPQASYPLLVTYGGEGFETIREKSVFYGKRLEGSQVISNIRFHGGSVKPKIEGGQTLRFFGLPEGMAYTVEELPTTSSGVFPTYEGQKNGTIVGGQNVDLTITNHVLKGDSSTLSAEIQIEGGDELLTRGDHLFELVLSPIDDAPMPEGTLADGNLHHTIKVAAGRESSGPVQLGTLPIEAPGVYKYKLTQLRTPAYEHIAYDNNTFFYSVEVTEDAQGAYVVKTQGQDAHDQLLPTPLASFKNAYLAVRFNAQVSVSPIRGNAHPWSALIFAVRLTGDQGAPMPEGSSSGVKMLSNLRIEEGGELSAIQSFGEIVYAKPGKYTYTLEQIVQSDRYPFLQFDTTAYRYQVEVQQDSTGKMMLKTLPLDGQIGSTVVFENYYEYLAMQITKRVAGKGASASTRFPITLTLYHPQNGGDGEKVPLADWRFSGASGMVQGSNYQINSSRITYRTDESGKVTFNLPHRGFIRLYDLPDGVLYSIGETAPQNYYPSYTVRATQNGKRTEKKTSGTLHAREGTISVMVTNTFSTEPKTGYGDPMTQTVLLTLCLATAIIAAVLRKRLDHSQKEERA